MLGKLPITDQQAESLNVRPHTQLSPLFENCCLRVCACESFQNAEADIATLTGMSVSHSTLQRLSQRTQLDWPDAKQKVGEMSVDGGKVRLRTPTLRQPSEWRDYKSVRLEDFYYAAAFRDNESLQNWVNTQPLVKPLVCLGDGHMGVWSFYDAISSAENRFEILDWFHLKENLYKVGGSFQRLKQAESDLWQGEVDAALALFADCGGEPAQRFCKYLKRHRSRIVNYAYYQAENICSIGSGSVESSIKQIDQRLKLPGAQWLPDNVNPMLGIRCAYLNGYFDTVLQR